MYEKEIVSEVMTGYGLKANKIFTPTEEVEDRIALGMVEAIGKKSTKFLMLCGERWPIKM